MSRPDYLPSHDHAYSWISNNADIFYDVIDEVIGDGDGELLEKLLDENPEIRYNFEADSHGKSGGYWDIIISRPKKIFIEYKVSIEESNVEEVIRKLKKRHSSRKGKLSRHLSRSVLITFDERFERYRTVLENERINLIVFSDSKRKRLRDKFSEEKESDKSTLDSF